jgi:hypothetical protein
MSRRDLRFPFESFFAATDFSKSRSQFKALQAKFGRPNFFGVAHEAAVRGKPHLVGRWMDMA